MLFKWTSMNRNTTCDRSIRWMDFKTVACKCKRGIRVKCIKAEATIGVERQHDGEAAPAPTSCSLRWKIPQLPLPTSHFTASSHEEHVSCSNVWVCFVCVCVPKGTFMKVEHWLTKLHHTSVRGGGWTYLTFSNRVSSSLTSLWTSSISALKQRHKVHNVTHNNSRVKGFNIFTHSNTWAPLIPFHGFYINYRSIRSKYKEKNNQWRKRTNS